MPKKIAVLLDGGHVRVWAVKANKTFDPAYIEKIAHACAVPNLEEIHRIMYYDCAPFTGSVQLPVSGGRRNFNGNDQWLRELSRKDLFAVRLGNLKFRGFVLKNISRPVARRGLRSEVRTEGCGYADWYRHGEHILESFCGADRLGNQ